MVSARCTCVDLINRRGFIRWWSTRAQQEVEGVELTPYRLAAAFLSGNFSSTRPRRTGPTPDFGRSFDSPFSVAARRITFGKRRHSCVRRIVYQGQEKVPIVC